MNDKLGRLLNIGDEVVYAVGPRDTEIGKITKMGEKMLTAGTANRRRYPNEVLKITADGAQITSIPDKVAKTILHALRLSSGIISVESLEIAEDWIIRHY